MEDMKILLETRMFGKNLSWFLGHFHVKVSILQSCFNDKTRFFYPNQITRCFVVGVQEVKGNQCLLVMDPFFRDAHGTKRSAEKLGSFFYSQYGGFHSHGGTPNGWV